MSAAEESVKEDTDLFKDVCIVGVEVVNAEDPTVDVPKDLLD